MCTTRVLAAIFVPWCAVAGAAADSLVAVDYSDLRGVLTLQPGAAGGRFTAGAVNEPGLLSSGLLWRTASPPGEAMFDTGFVSEPNPADAVIDLTIGTINDKRADILGTAIFTDVDGDVVTLVLGGTMAFGPAGQVVANAIINGIEVRSDDGYFDGSDSGSVSTADFEDGRGTLTLNFTYQFHQTGDGRRHIGPASISGEANAPRGVPAPGAAGLFAAAALAMGRRRRRIQGALCSLVDEASRRRTVRGTTGRSSTDFGA